MLWRSCRHIYQTCLRLCWEENPTGPIFVFPDIIFQDKNSRQQRLFSSPLPINTRSPLKSKSLAASRTILLFYVRPNTFYMDRIFHPNSRPFIPPVLWFLLSSAHHSSEWVSHNPPDPKSQLIESLVPYKRRHSGTSGPIKIGKLVQRPDSFLSKIRT